MPEKRKRKHKKRLGLRIFLGVLGCTDIDCVGAMLIPFIGILTKRQTLFIPLWKPKRLGMLGLI